MADLGTCALLLLLHAFSWPRCTRPPACCCQSQPAGEYGSWNAAAVVADAPAPAPAPAAAAADDDDDDYDDNLWRASLRKWKCNVQGS